MRGLVQKVRKRQTGTPAENEGMLTIRYPRCPGLARAINSTYLISSLEAIEEITYIHCKRWFWVGFRCLYPQKLFVNYWKEGKAEMSASQKQRLRWEEGNAAARLTTAQNSGQVLGISKDDRASYCTGLLLLSLISSGVFITSFLFLLLEGWSEFSYIRTYFIVCLGFWSLSLYVKWTKWVQVKPRALHLSFSSGTR